jgi:DHA1 family bicyclomycin/chloramphenicol resistance-like MFS transporter
MLRAATSPPRFFTLVLMTALSVLSLNMFLPSLANIARDLNTSYALASLSVSGFLAVNAVVQLVIGPIADRYGRRPVLLWAVLLFVLASVVAALAQDIWLFLAARVVQAAIIAGSALAFAVINDTHTRDAAASKLGYLAMAMAVAPMLAPTLGGALDETLGWRSNFWAFAVLGCVLLWLVWTDLGETNPTPSDTFRDQLRAYPELLRSRRFWGYALVQSFCVGGFFVFIAAASLVGEQAFGLSPTAVGIGIGSITGGYVIGSFLSGRYATRMGVLWMILAGRVATLTGVGLGLAWTVLAGPTPWAFFAAAITYGFGNGVSVPSARAGSMALRPHLAGSASGLVGAMIVGSGAIFIALPGLLLTRENGPWLTLTMLLGIAVAALFAALYTRAIERQETAQAA